MTPEKKVDYWIDIAIYDLDTAKAMLGCGRYLYAAFMCQQAIEKLLKALIIHKTAKKEPPRSHNLTFLLDQLELKTVPPELSHTVSWLSAYYIESRYPNYKEHLSKLVDRAEAEKLLENTEEAFSWLQSLMK